MPNPLFQEDYSTVVLDRNDDYLRIFLNTKDMWYLPPDTSTIPEKLIMSVIYFEDKRFWHHPGIDPIALCRAIKQNISTCQNVSGASTITMQVIRLSGRRHRTIKNKIIETILALKLELKYSKSEILSMYLNNAPYGGNIIGYRSAILRYYSKMPDELTWAEASMLAVLPNTPSLINPDSNSDALLKKRNRLLKRLHADKVIDDETYELSLMESIPDGQIPFDIHAPHLARYLSNRQKGQIHTTIQKSIQIHTEKIVKDYADELVDYGINNYCAIVIKTDTYEFIAYVGSQDFFNNKLNGMVDGIIAPRSYGSVLKPFLYALSMDKGIIIPQTKLKDIPTYYGSFSPYNADMAFSGIVTAKQALVRSLNVPAVRLLYTYDYHEFYDFLKLSGITTLDNNADYYGLTAILGGAEATPFDIAKLYCGLGNMGQFQQLKMLKGDSTNVESKQLISPGAAILTLDMLKDVHRPGSEFYHSMFSNQYEIAWKTGTSYGQRDAWAAGVTPEWTIVVWAGNFTGEGNPILMGARTAGPLMFRIFNSLPKNSEKIWYDKPEIYFENVAICEHSGYRVSEYCTDTIIAQKPRSDIPLNKCPYHKNVFLNSDSTEQVCSQCWQNTKVIESSWLVYPPEVAQFMRKRGESYLSLPPHRNTCPVSGSGNFIDFIYPKSGQKIFVPKGISGEYQKIIMKAGHIRENVELYWYLDDVFIGSTIDGSLVKNHTIAIVPKTGNHSLTITDDEGNSESILFETAIGNR